jgi:seryl-tRNA(Sec) selenium transferase
MWMSNVLIVVDRNNPDRNSLTDLAAAVGETGANIINIDEENLVIEADLPTHEVVVVAAMDGVAYVRSVFSYFKDPSPPEEVEDAA